MPHEKKIYIDEKVSRVIVSEFGAVQTAAFSAAAVPEIMREKWLTEAFKCQKSSWVCNIHQKMEKITAETPLTCLLILIAMEELTK